MWIFLVDKAASNIFLTTTTEKHTVRQYDSHNAVGLDVVEVVKQKSIVGCTLGGNAVFFITGVKLGYS